MLSISWIWKIPDKILIASLRAAQWIVAGIFLLTIVGLFYEIRLGNMAVNGGFFLIDLFVYAVSALIGLGCQSYFKKHRVRLVYRSWISVALWWTLVGFPHSALGMFVIFPMIFGGVITFFTWLQVIQLLIDDRRARKT